MIFRETLLQAPKSFIFHFNLRTARIHSYQSFAIATVDINSTSPMLSQTRSLIIGDLSSLFASLIF